MLSTTLHDWLAHQEAKLRDAPFVQDPHNGKGSRFEISLDVVDGEAVVGVVGEVDAATAPELDAIARKLCEQRHSLVVLDLSQVGFIDGAGLRVINQTAQRLREQGGSLRLRSPSTFTARLLELVDMAALVEPEVPPED